METGSSKTKRNLIEKIRRNYLLYLAEMEDMDCPLCRKDILERIKAIEVSKDFWTNCTVELTKDLLVASYMRTIVKPSPKLAFITQPWCSLATDVYRRFQLIFSGLIKLLPCPCHPLDLACFLALSSVFLPETFFLYLKRALIYLCDEKESFREIIMLLPTYSKLRRGMRPILDSTTPESVLTLKMISKILDLFSSEDFSQEF